MHVMNDFIELVEMTNGGGGFPSGGNCFHGGGGGGGVGGGGFGGGWLFNCNEFNIMKNIGVLTFFVP